MAHETRTVRAAVLHEARRPLVVEEVRLEPPRAGEVLVRVAAAGVCHSDLHLAEGHLGDGRWPTVLGHEGSGVVEEVGAGVGHVAPGDPVAFCFVPSCGTCPECLAGRRNLCRTAAGRSWAGTLLDGTSRLSLLDGRPLKHFNFVSCFAERSVVPAGSAVPIPPVLPLWQAAVIGCGVVTGVGAVRHAARVEPGESVAVVGCGGVGLQVVAGARLARADPIVAVDRDPAKLERALAAGATHVLDSVRDDPVAATLGLTSVGVDHAFEVVGQPETVRLAWDLLRPGATAVVVGIVPKGVEVAVPGIELLAEKGLKGSYYGSGDPAADVAELARLAADGLLDLATGVSDLTDLDGLEAAFDRLRRGDGAARTVAILDPVLAGAVPAS
ncbi:MAG TPA: alcohol dehydrogenase catalytic domain-containing protein [Actinomycetes bacterium]|nr:alcohol dehydrogenase catalytic domain-containing protein [Actinomycetes bacterium]